VLDPTVNECAWEAHSAKDGRVYYYNTFMRISQWEKPAAFAKFVEAVRGRPCCEAGCSILLLTTAPAAGLQEQQKPRKRKRAAGEETARLKKEKRVRTDEERATRAAEKERVRLMNDEERARHMVRARRELGGGSCFPRRRGFYFSLPRSPFYLIVSSCRPSARFRKQRGSSKKRRKKSRARRSAMPIACCGALPRMKSARRPRPPVKRLARSAWCLFVFCSLSILMCCSFVIGCHGCQGRRAQGTAFVAFSGTASTRHVP
jgi:hypothetical protein